MRTHYANLTAHRDALEQNIDTLKKKVTDGYEWGDIVSFFSNILQQGMFFSSALPVRFSSILFLFVIIFYVLFLLHKIKNLEKVFTKSKNKHLRWTTLTQKGNRVRNAFGAK